LDKRIRELACGIGGSCPRVADEVLEPWLNNEDDQKADDEAPIKVPDPPEDEAPFVEPETPKVGSRDSPGG
jgi:hypothetical protein